MGKVPNTGSVSNTTTLEDLRRFADQLFKNIVAQVNGNLTFSDNITSNGNGIIYETLPADNNALYLAATAAINAKILVI